MRLAAIACALFLTAGCGSESTAPDPPAEGPDADASLDASEDGAAPADDAAAEANEDASDAPAPDVVEAADEDAGASPDADADADAPDASPSDASDAGPGADGGTYRNSLSICWTDPACPRVLAIAHGGAWDPVVLPYDSNGAIAAAYADGIDGVKIDVRVTKDDVPVISHSSPIELYESLDCSGKKIEEMTAAEVGGCHRLPSFTETFQRLDDVLGYLRGKMVAQLTVKLSTDYARTIEVVHALGAEDYVFLEISTGELATLIPTLPGADTIYYLVNVGSTMSEVDTLIDTIKNPRAFMYEFDSTVQLGNLATARLHPAGVRAFTYDSSATAGVGELQAFYQGGYDVVSSQTALNGVQARIAVNQSRGVTPP